MKAIIFPVLTLGGMGLFFGLLLAVSSKIFHVDQDERLGKLTEVLPGANCGGCGYAGCANLASAILEGKAPVNGCPVGGAEVAAKVAEIMGVKAGDSGRMVAHVNCCGGCKAKPKYNYQGVSDCLAASKVAGGPLQCTQGCLGYGSCVQVCEYDAIHVVDGVAVVDEAKCKACGRCVAACPKNLIFMVEDKHKVFVNCASTAKGGEVRQLCEVGCIGCMLCQKACPKDAIHVEKNLAVIDYDKCISCGLCAKACPRGLILNTRQPKAAQTQAPAEEAKKDAPVQPEKPAEPAKEAKKESESKPAPAKGKKK